MTGDNMKSDLLDSSQVKLEGRQAISKRRMSKNSAVLPLENGESDDTGTNVQDCGLRCSKSNDIYNNLDKQRDKKGEITGHGIICSSEQPRFSKDDTKETRHLKELLLLHLDLSQHQQEIILAKDRQIQSLRKEKEALKCRLERMERRMALLRHKEAGSRTTVEQQVNSSPTPLRLEDKRENQSRGIKRKHSLEPRSLELKFSAARVGGDDEEEKKSRGFYKSFVTTYRSHRHRFNKNLNFRHSNSCFKSIKRIKNLMDHEQIAEEKRQKILEALKDRTRIQKEGKILRTDIMYYVPDSEHEIIGGLSPLKSQKPSVQVPTWRINPVPRGFQLEGTENLEDEIYLKRHQKPETDEKRRKRWDLQRLRERTQHERLLQSREAENRVERKETIYKSFVPEPANVEYIEVCDTIPVSAFGYPVPELKSTEFEIPWGDMTKREEKPKPGRHKKR